MNLHPYDRKKLRAGVTEELEDLVSSVLEELPADIADDVAEREYDYAALADRILARMDEVAP